VPPCFPARTSAREKRQPRDQDQGQFRTAIRERPEETAYAAAWAEGRAMILEQAVERAVAETTD
jgi:hypothetical protein